MSAKASEGIIPLFIFQHAFRGLVHVEENMAETYTDKLRSLTYAVIHNPNCPSPFQVRLVAERAAMLDHLACSRTRDVCGHGQSLEEAARDAWNKRFGVVEELPQPERS